MKIGEFLHPNKISNDRKDYTDDNLKQIQLISMLRKLNLSLKDIAELFNLDKLYDDEESNSDEKADIIKKVKVYLKKHIMSY